MGIVRFATLSDGKILEPVNSLKAHADRLAKAQRRMGRKIKFSQNWKKEKAKVQKMYRRISHVRRDFLHKASTPISKNHAMVCMEDLKVKNMSRSAAGTLAEPGRNVRAKAGLNRSILDQGWSEFRRQLEYKLAWRGGVLLLVPPQNTSRTCPRCAYVSKNNRLTQARFCCVLCGYEEHADLVGAINVLRAGHARIACGETASARGTLAQEPTEATAREVILA
jgi:putative transposase